METKVAAVSMRGVTKTFGAVIANEDVDLDIYKGEILALLGENGSGKTTLMNMLSGIYFPDQGQIMINGQNVVIASPKDALNLGIGMVHQHFKLVDVLTAAENIILGLPGKEILDMQEVVQKITELVERYGFELNPNQKIYEMSVSQKQTVEIIKVLYRGAGILILDEPINGLDPEGIREIRECLLKLNREEGKTILISSHILGELSKIATQYGIIKDGRLIRQMTKEDLEEQCRDYLLVEVEHTERAAAVLAENIPDVSFEVFAQGRIHIYDYLDSGQVTTLLVQNGVTVYSCGLHQIDLEQYFLELMDGGAK